MGVETVPHEPPPTIDEGRLVMRFRREMQRRIQQLRHPRLGDPDSGPQSRRLPEDWP